MADWTTPKTWSTGEKLRAADLNAYLRDNMDVLLELAGTPISATIPGQGFRSSNTWGPLDDQPGPTVRFMAGPTGKVSIGISARLRTIDTNWDRAFASWRIRRESDNAIVQEESLDRAILGRLRGVMTFTYLPRLVNLQAGETYEAEMRYMTMRDDSIGNDSGQMAAGARLIQVTGALPAPD